MFEAPIFTGAKLTTFLVAIALPPPRPLGVGNSISHAHMMRQITQIAIHCHIAASNQCIAYDILDLRFAMAFFEAH